MKNYRNGKKGNILNWNYLNARQQPFHYYDCRDFEVGHIFMIKCYNQLKMFIHCLEKHKPISIPKRECRKKKSKKLFILSTISQQL